MITELDARNVFPSSILTRVNFDGPYSVLAGSKCWIWAGGKHKGYGATRWRPWGLASCGKRGKTVKAHRLFYAYLCNNGTDIDPEVETLDHGCHIAACVNPNHLTLTNHKENRENLIGANRLSKSRVRGVVLRPDGKYEVSVKHNRVCYYFGRHTCLEQASYIAVMVRAILFTNSPTDFRDRLSAEKGLSPENYQYIDKAKRIAGMALV